MLRHLRRLAFSNPLIQRKASLERYLFGLHCFYPADERKKLFLELKPQNNYSSTNLPSYCNFLLLRSPPLSLAKWTEVKLSPLKI
jgi:hypothetical protein